MAYARLKDNSLVPLQVVESLPELYKQLKARKSAVECVVTLAEAEQLKLVGKAELKWPDLALKLVIHHD